MLGIARIGQKKDWFSDSERGLSCQLSLNPKTLSNSKTGQSKDFSSAKKKKNLTENIMKRTGTPGHRAEVDRAPKIEAIPTRTPLGIIPTEWNNLFDVILGHIDEILLV